MPKKGMRLVNRSRGKEYGTILYVKNDEAGTVVWRSDNTGSKVKSNPESFRKDGNTYEKAED